MRIASLAYQGEAYDETVNSNNRHIDALKRMFVQEQGCRQEDTRHHAKALISQKVLEAAVACSSITTGSLMADTIPYPELDLPPGTRVECLQGYNRLTAAEVVLRGPKQR